MTEATQQTDVCPGCGGEIDTLTLQTLREFGDDKTERIYRCSTRIRAGEIDQSPACRIRELESQLAAAVGRAEKAERERDDAKQRLEMWRNQFADRR